jgi:DNA-binding NtrC family response regulator
LPLETFPNFARTSSVAVEDLSSPPDGRWSPEERDERARIVEALRAEGGNQSRAARRLGISRGALITRLDTFEIARPQKRQT